MNLSGNKLLVFFPIMHFNSSITKYLQNHLEEYAPEYNANIFKT